MVFVVVVNRLPLLFISMTTVDVAQNNAVRLIFKAPRTDHITPHLRSLLWLPVDARIKYKISSLCFGAITFTGHMSSFLIYARSTRLPPNFDLL